MRTTIRRDHTVDLVIGNRRPFAVDLDLVMVADHPAFVGSGSFTSFALSRRVRFARSRFMSTRDSASSPDKATRNATTWSRSYVSRSVFRPYILGASAASLLNSSGV